MTTSNNRGLNIGIAVVVVLMLLLALRSIFYVLPFGLFPGMTKPFRDAGHWLRGFGDWGPFEFFPLFVLPIAFAALWIFVLIWVYKDAERRGMNGILWLLLVLIGNVIGLLIYAIVRSERPLKRPEAPSPGKCPGCGNALGTGFAFCPHCGRNLQPACPSCKKPVESGWKVCPACGAGLDPGKTEQG